MEYEYVHGPCLGHMTISGRVGGMNSVELPRLGEVLWPEEQSVTMRNPFSSFSFSPHSSKLCFAFQEPLPLPPIPIGKWISQLLFHPNGVLLVPCLLFSSLRAFKRSENIPLSTCCLLSRLFEITCLCSGNFLFSDDFRFPPNPITSLCTILLPAPMPLNTSLPSFCQHLWASKPKEPAKQCWC